MRVFSESVICNRSLLVYKFHYSSLLCWSFVMYYQISHDLKEKSGILCHNLQYLKPFFQTHITVFIGLLL